jgi:hypothetical protein
MINKIKKPWHVGVFFAQQMATEKIVKELTWL